MGKTSGGGRDGGMKARRKRRSGRRGGKRRNEERVAERGRARTMMQGLELVRVVQGAYQKGCGQSREEGGEREERKEGGIWRAWGDVFFFILMVVHNLEWLDICLLRRQEKEYPAADSQARKAI